MPLHNFRGVCVWKQTKEERVSFQLQLTVLLLSRGRGLHWAALPWKELLAELGDTTWPYLYARARLIFPSISAIRANLLYLLITKMNAT